MDFWPWQDGRSEIKGQRSSGTLKGDCDHSPSVPQPSPGQCDSCQNPDPVVESRTQARLSQSESEHWPQQQLAPVISSYLQSSASRFEQGLPGEARLHSDKRFDQSDDRSKDQSLKYTNKNDQIPPKHLGYLTG